VIQTPHGQTVTFRINGLDIHLGSTVVVTLANGSGSDRPALVITLLQGRLSTTVGVAPVELAQPGRTAPEALPARAITLNEQGQ
jgi:hypothetical protein